MELYFVTFYSVNFMLKIAFLFPVLVLAVGVEGFL